MKKFSVLCIVLFCIVQPGVTSLDPEPNTTTAIPSHVTLTTKAESTTEHVTETTAKPTASSTTNKVTTAETTSTVITTTSTPTTEPTTSPTTKPTISSTTIPIEPVITTALPIPDPISGKGRHFDGLSFMGGIIMTVCIIGVGLVSWKVVRICTERRYHTF